MKLIIRPYITKEATSMYQKELTRLIIKAHSEARYNTVKKHRKNKKVHNARAWLDALEKKVSYDFTIEVKK